jgi:thermolabile hemolysin
VSHDTTWQDTPWQVHCETARTYEVNTQATTGAVDRDWLFARDADGASFSMTGTLVDGFFEVATLRAPSSEPIVPSRLGVRQLCLNTVNSVKSDNPRMLGWVMAARPGEEVNIPPVYPDEIASGDRVTRVVIFGDSLTDTGRLKERLRIFPAKPYWIGRFSNGPAWPEYLAMGTGLGVQNHSYGGASAAIHEALPGSNVYARTKEVGQFFVSGTIELQIDDYIERTLAAGRIERADSTAYLIWAGANDYISKEPVTGLITTFLNSPEGESGYKAVVERAITHLAKHVRTLYGAGARRFVMINLPDLGRTPIVLQNTTYIPENLQQNDVARRLELAHRLTQLTLYHNQLLAETIELLRAEMPAAQILLVDTFNFFQQLNGIDETAVLRPQEYGFDLAALEDTLAYEGTRLSLQQPCYRGTYLGTLDSSKICPRPDKALFWDTVHPTTLTHCWQAWKVGSEMASAGWIHPLPDPSTYLGWCQGIVKSFTLGPVVQWNSQPAPRESEN